MVLILYYVVMILGNVLSAWFFRDQIQLLAASLAPVIGMGSMVFIAAMYRTDAPDMRENFQHTAYGSPLTEKEEKTALRFWSKCCFYGAPLHLPLILFGGAGVKTVGTLLIVLSTLAAAALGFRVKYQRSIRARLDAENEERKRQIQREEQGRF